MLYYITALLWSAMFISTLFGTEYGKGVTVAAMAFAIAFNIDMGVQSRRRRSNESHQRDER